MSGRKARFLVDHGGDEGRVEVVDAGISDDVGPVVERMAEAHPPAGLGVLQVGEPGAGDDHERCQRDERPPDHRVSCAARSAT